ncbi:toprim domain-containing protein [Microbulbifer sp. ALW1]|uniref:toprim domain-containing protein n=1 Tax=Microbulbifer sp. (strain ALW1) TaxID=1516059 RepID=UPI00135708F9|nr:toprim domain-containing protein [Microbulbifer sp. ALW1]
MSSDTSTSRVEQFLSALHASGYAPVDVQADGRWHRFKTNDDKHKQTTGFYKVEPDYSWAIYGDWRRDPAHISWKPDADELSPEEARRNREEIRRHRREQLRLEQFRQSEAASVASTIWSAAQPLSAFPYAQRKRIPVHGLRLTQSYPKRDGSPTRRAYMLIPIFGFDGKIWSLQFIPAFGNKLFLPDGKKKGCYFPFGPIGQTVIVAEGYATGATIRAATKLPVLAAFDAGNLLPVCRNIRKHYRSTKIIIAADNDWETKGNPGLNKARNAAMDVGAKIVYPTQSALRPGESDFNDLYLQYDNQRQGLAEIKKCFKEI